MCVCLSICLSVCGCGCGCVFHEAILKYKIVSFPPPEWADWDFFLLFLPPPHIFKKIFLLPPPLLYILVKKKKLGGGGEFSTSRLALIFPTRPTGNIFLLKDRQHRSMADITFFLINRQLRGLEYCFIYQMKGYFILYFGIYIHVVKKSKVKR